eukprot:scaffold748_cov251-Pinguiococcus_pyrenoidosus.AAC.23
MERIAAKQQGLKVLAAGVLEHCERAREDSAIIPAAASLRQNATIPRSDMWMRLARLDDDVQQREHIAALEADLRILPRRARDGLSACFGACRRLLRPKDTGTDSFSNALMTTWLSCATRRAQRSLESSAHLCHALRRQGRA